MGANTLKGLDDAILGPSQNDELRASDDDAHVAFGHRFLFAHPFKHASSSSRTQVPRVAANLHVREEVCRKIGAVRAVGT